MNIVKKTIEPSKDNASYSTKSEFQTSPQNTTKYQMVGAIKFVARASLLSLKL